VALEVAEEEVLALIPSRLRTLVRLLASDQEAGL
jgi:hypothetical protein